MSTPSSRVVSLDALRGFDMFWILGMEEFAAALGRASPSPVAKLFATQLGHVAWAGFHFLDLIFPLFVFISGVSLVFSLNRSIEQRGRSGTISKLLTRAVMLYLLGLIYYGGIAGGLEGIRWVGVLQRIAFCGLAGGLLYCLAGERWRSLAAAVTVVVVLVGYWALLSFVPVPGGQAGDFAAGPQHNLVNWFDFRFLPGRRWDGTHDPEGLLSTIPAIATCLLGVLAGEHLRRPGVAPGRKAVNLMLAGVVLAAAGWLWHLQFPVIKRLWTSSYVLVAGGYSALLLGVFYWVIDVRGWKRWCTPAVWIGMNAIALYLAFQFIGYRAVAEALAGGPVAKWSGAYGDVLIAAVVIGLNILAARFLHAHKIFLKV